MSGSNKDTFNGSNPLAEQIRANVVNAYIAEQAGAVSVAALGGATLPAVTQGYGLAVLQSPQSGLASLPPSYPVLLVTGATGTVIGGGGPNQAVAARTGGLTYQFAGGGGVIYTAANGSSTGDTLFLDGATTITAALGQGQDTVVASSGTNYIAAGAGANVIFLEGGSNFVGSEGADQIVQGIGSAAAAGSATISLSGSGTVFGGSGQLLLAGGTAPSFLFPQTDSTSGALTSTGSATVFGGAGGGAYYGGGGGRNLMVTGQAATTLVGGGANDTLFATGAGNHVLQAGGAGGVLVGTGATGNNEFFAAAGGTAMFGGSGQDIFVAGAGNDSLSAGAGADQFDFTAGESGGVDLIFGFKPGVDQVNLFGYDSGDGSAGANALAQAAANVNGGSTYITLSDSTRIFFVGVTSLTPNSIVG